LLGKLLREESAKLLDRKETCLKSWIIVSELVKLFRSRLRPKLVACPETSPKEPIFCELGKLFYFKLNTELTELHREHVDNFQGRG
jgi:hypothetical protein